MTHFNKSKLVDFDAENIFLLAQNLLYRPSHMSFMIIYQRKVYEYLFMYFFGRYYFTILFKSKKYNSFNNSLID